MTELRLPAVVENIPRVIQFIEEQLEAVDCGMKAQTQISVAVDELMANVVSYAYTHGAGEVTVRFELDEATRQAAVTFIDTGMPFNPLKRPDPDVTLSAKERPIGGLGIFLVKKTMDDVRYEFSHGRNILTILKKI